jgi:hypothetical protein
MVHRDRSGRTFSRAGFCGLFDHLREGLGLGRDTYHSNPSLGLKENKMRRGGLWLDPVARG